MRRKSRRQRRRGGAVCVLLIVLVVLCLAGYWNLGGRKAVVSAKLGSEGYPQSLIELLEKNPEAKDFVLHYPDRIPGGTIDLSGEVKAGEIPLFLQWDERWGYETYGDDFLAVTGCGPTCLSMVRCGLSGDTQWDPYSVAQMAQESGYYVEGVGSSWDLMVGGAAQIGLTVEQIAFDQDAIREALRKGHPVICSMGPGDFTTSGHFIVLAAVDEEGKIAIRDPNSRKNSRKSWELTDLMAQMRNLWSYRM